MVLTLIKRWMEDEIQNYETESLKSAAGDRMEA
jgi:hypothetical protein